MTSQPPQLILDNRPEPRRPSVLRGAWFTALTGPFQLLGCSHPPREDATGSPLGLESRWRGNCSLKPRAQEAGKGIGKEAKRARKSESPQGGSTDVPSH